jgi:cbb3-type cytochrome oxidase subunit 3
MNLANWIALTGVVIVFIGGFFYALRYIIRAESNEEEVKRLQAECDKKDAKIERLRDHIKGTN